MANEVGHAFVTLIPSLKGASARIQSELRRSGVANAMERTLTSSATRAGTRSGGLFSRAFGSVTRNINFPGPSPTMVRNLRTYGFAIAGVTSLTVGLGLKTASAFEQAKIAFTTILGSAKQAKALFGSLVQFAKKTPFELPGVVAATQKLLAFGFTARQVKPTLTSLGDAAAGLSLGTEGLDRLTTAIGQIQAKGRVQSDELLQLTEAGVPALRVLANQFGVTTGKLQKYVSAGLVPAKKAIPALLRGLETGTKGLAGTTARFGGLMQKQSRTLGGLFSNLKDTLSVGLARAVRPLVPVLKRALPGAMKTLQGALRTAGRDLAEFLHGLGLAKDRSKGTTTGFEKFGSAVRHVFNAVRSTLGFIGEHSRVFKTLAVAIGTTVAAFTAMRVAMFLLNTAMNAGPIGALISLTAGFIYAYKTSEKFRSIVQAVFHALEFAAGQFVSISVRAIKFVADAFLGWAGSMIHVAAAAFGWVPGIGPKLKVAAAKFDEFRANVDSALSGIADDAAGWGVTTGNNYVGGFFSAFDQIPASMRRIFGFSSTFDFGSGGFGKNGKWGAPAKKAGQAVTDGLSGGLDLGSLKTKKSMSGLVDKILKPLRDLRQKAAQLAQSVTQAILGETGFGALLDQTDAFGMTSFGTSVRAIISGFVSQKRAVIQFRKELRLLDKRGLSAGSISDIANLGLSRGGGVAETLLTATRKQLRRISRLRRGINQGAAGTGTDVASARFGAQINRELVKTIERASKNTELGPKTMRRFDRALSKERRRDRVYLDTKGLDRHDGQVVASLV